MEIVFDNVSYIENKGTILEREYLKDISFSIKDNKIYSFIGSTESGINKIPELINAIKKPTKGTVLVDGFINDGRYIKNINKLRFNVGYIKLIPDLFNKTVKKEVSFSVKHFKYRLNKEQIRIEEALQLVGLNSDYMKRKISDLDINEKKKVSIASTLIYNPKIIIFEEPTAFLLNSDIEKLKKLFRLLKNKYNKTIIVITKDTDFAYEVSDEAYLFNNGRLISNDKVLTNRELLDEANVKTPRIIDFIDEANKRDANLTYTNNILDLIKEVYRNARL